MWTEFQVACRLGCSVGWFSANYEKLRTKGFPQKDVDFDKWDADAIERWLDERAGLIPRSRETVDREARNAWKGVQNALRHQSA